MCGLSLLSWDLIIGAGCNIQKILATTVLLLDVTCVGAFFWGRPLPPAALKLRPIWGRPQQVEAELLCLMCIANASLTFMLYILLDLIIKQLTVLPKYTSSCNSALGLLVLMTLLPNQNKINKKPKIFSWPSTQNVGMCLMTS